jgi:hypothetical protein
MTAVHRCGAGLAIVIGITLTAVPARAQAGSASKWEIEVHGGGMRSSSGSDGNAATLPGGTPFTTAFGFPSRREATWLFGDGAQLLNDVNAALRATGRITALDPVLGSAAASRGSGGSAGFRLARRLGSRYAAEFALDYARAPLTFDQQALDAIETSRSSFVTAFRGLLATGPFTNSNVTSTADIRKGSGHQVLTTGVLTVDLVTRGRLIPYVSGGGGVVTAAGNNPTAAITGTYSFSIAGVAPINETDHITLRVVDRGRSGVAVFGGGIRFAASPRWGVRVDVRASAGGGKTDTVVDASPAIVTGSPAGFIASATNPSVQFSTVPGTTLLSNLSGPAINGLKTFSTSGSAVRTNVAAGIYWRF